MRFDTVLIANRGEIARRIIRTCKRLGYRSIAVFSDADANAPFVREADEAVHIGPAPSRESYLVTEKLIEAARRTRAGAIHPGYGFLAENADFAAACEAAGLIFVGLRPETIRAMGSKIESKKLMESYDVPVIPGYFGDDQSDARLVAEGEGIGYPVLLKASAGGGGKGMRIVNSTDELRAAIPAARREALSAFGDDTIFLERYIPTVRHVEFQILGDEHGNLVHVFERECSIQRRHQKIIEETPSVALDPELRAAMGAAAVRAGEAMGYRSAGTVELLLAPNRHFYFLEVNTRLQVEHPVTEMTTGLDLVELQLEVAQGARLPFVQSDLVQRGHAIECRLYSENPENQFLPATGTLADWHFEPLDGLRVDSGVERGDAVTIYYDPLLAKVVTWGKTREEATRRMVRALEDASIQGVTTNRSFLVDILRHDAWERGELDTRFIERHFGAEGWRETAAPEQQRLALIIATLDAARDRSAALGHLPRITPGFRNSRWRDTEQRWLVGESSIEVRYRARSERHYQLQLGEDAHEVRLHQAADGNYELECDGHRVRARVARASNRFFVHVLGRSFAFEAADRLPLPHATSAGGGCVAPMPGKVLQVLVEVGATVSKGQALVIVEAMKMEHTVAAPFDATVRAVLVAVQEQVEADQPLVELEEGESA